MSLVDDTTKEVPEIFAWRWTEPDGETVPEPEGFKLTNVGVNPEADTRQLLVARMGIRGSNHFVWVSRAVNHAAKLLSWCKPSHVSWIKAGVFDIMLDEANYVDEHNELISTKKWWTEYGIQVCGSSRSQKPAG